MARLREQRNAIRNIYNIREGVTYSSRQGNDLIAAIVGISNKAELIMCLRQRPTFLGEEEGEFPSKSEEEGFLHRLNKLGALIQSCIDAGLLVEIEHPTDKKSLPCYIITDKGTDLLNWLGFSTIFLGKYEIWKVVLSSSAVTGILGYIIASLI